MNLVHSLVIESNLVYSLDSSYQIVKQTKRRGEISQIKMFR